MAGWVRRAPRGGWISAGLAAVTLLAATSVPTTAQAPPFSSTLRYGSGYLDVPVAAVLPNLALRANWSGFWVTADRDPEVDASGDVVGPGDAPAGFHGDASFSMGFLERVELGTSVQSFTAEADGGHLVGAFGKLLLLDPSRSGLGVAVGGRWLRAPDYGDGVERAPTRLGFGDRRARAEFTDGRTLDTQLTLYGVATLTLPGLTYPWLPPNQFTLTGGYGTGMFQEGGDLPWYAPSGTGGWFAAGSWEVAAGERTVLALSAEHNGFDVNLEAELAWRDLRVAAHALGVDHGDGSSVYRSRKYGLSVSLTACPLLNRACRPGIRAGAPRDTVRLPAPPPDTVVVARETFPPGVGVPVQLCLATGEDAWVLVTSVGDTLVGPSRRALASLPPGEGLPGRYAREGAGFEPGAPLVLPEGVWLPVGDPERPACAALVPWGEVEGLPLFRLREAGSPPEVLMLPLAPGLWQRYRREEGGG